MTEREAANHLLLWAGLPRTSGRHLLRTGVAGVAHQQHDGSLGYDADAVDALTRWPVLEEADDLIEAAPSGIPVARLRPGRPWSTSWSGDREREVIAGPWAVNVIVRAGMGAGVLRDGYFPVILTICGFVLAGADVTGPLGLARDPISLPLGPPSGWYDRLRRTRWPGGRGGRALHVWFPPRTLPRRTA